MGCSGGDALERRRFSLPGRDCTVSHGMNARYNTNIAMLKKATFMVTIIIRCITPPAASTQNRPRRLQTRTAIANPISRVPHVAALTRIGLADSHSGAE